jgi:hypothetical protein
MISLNNPFSDYGKVVTKERFIGRKAEISRLQQRVLSSHSGACAAIVGEARIGKTSLMHHVFHRDAELVKECNGLVVSFNIGSTTVTTTSEFFTNIVRAVQRELRRVSKSDCEDLNIFAEELYDCIKSNSSDWSIVLLEYFQELGLKNYRVILLLDEFDSISRVFGENENAFQLLRQLGYEHRYATAIVTTSRITIGQIEVQSLISTLSGIFTDIHLGLFNEGEFKQLISPQDSDNFTERERQKIRSFAGLHPYYAQIVGFHIWDYKTSNSKKSLVDHEIDMAIDNCRDEMYEQFDNCKNRMGAERFKTLLTVTLGPSAILFSQFNLNRLIQQGHIIETKNGSQTQYKAFSQAYEEYLQFQQREIDLWPLWSETEKKLRHLIGDRYAKLAKTKQLPLLKFLEQAHPDLYDKYRKYENDQKREQRYFSATTSPFDYMAPNEIFEFLEANWSIFQDIFGGEDRRISWSNNFETLRTVRNPYAHSREYAVSEVKRREAENICYEILSKIESSKK